MGNVQFNRFRAMSRRIEIPVVLSPSNFEKPNHHRFEAAQLSLRSRWRAEVVRLRFCSANSAILFANLSMKEERCSNDFSSIGTEADACYYSGLS